MVDNHIRLTYNEIHKLIGASSAKIQEEFAPDVLIAIGSVPIMIFSTNLLTSDYPTTRRRVSGIGYEGSGV
jgi:hypoxanthine phosphoribosyltransferase